MVSRSRMKRQKFFNKIFLTTFGIVMLVLFCCFGLLFYVHNELNKTKLQEQDVYITAYSSYMEDVFRNAQNIFSYIEGDPETIKILLPGYQEPRDYFQSQKNLVNEVNRFSITSEDIDEIYVFSFNHNLLYTAPGTVQPSTYFYNRYCVGYDRWINFLEQEHNTPEVMYLDFPINSFSPATVSEPSHIALVKSIQRGTRTLGTIVITLKETIVQSLFQDKKFADGRHIYIMDNNDQVLSTNSDMPITTFNQHIDWEQLKSTGQYIGKFGLCSYRSSSLTNAKYMIVTPTKVVDGTLSEFFLIADIVLSVLGVFMFFLAYIIARRLYQPVYNILDVLKDVSLKEKSGKDELEEVRGKILEIVSLNYDLKNELQNSSQAVLESTLFKLIFGSSAEIPSVSCPGQYDLSFQQGYYNLFVIFADNLSSPDSTLDQDQIKQFNQIINQYLKDWLIAVVQTRPDEYSIVTFCKDEKNCNVINEVFPMIHQELTNEIRKTQFYIGYGSWISDIMKLQICYRFAASALGQRSINSVNAISVYKPGNGKKQYFLPNDLEVELFSYLKSNKKEIAKTYISHILSLNYKKSISVESYFTISNTINQFIIRYVEYAAPNESDLLITLDASVILYNVNRLNEIVLSNLDLAFSILANQTKQQIPVIDQIIKYVDENFNKDINLSSTAEKLGYTSNYLSRYFKQAKGINFTDYLNRKKIEYAKMLLTTTNQTIKQIMEESGFNNSALFFKTFERYEGITPGEFKKIKQKV